MRSTQTTITQLKRLKASELGESIIIVGKKAQLSSSKLSKVFHADLKSHFETFLKPQESELKAGAQFCTPSGGKNIPAFCFGALPESSETFDLLGFARQLCGRALEPKTSSLSLVFLDSKLEAKLAETFAAAICAKTFLMPSYGKRSKEAKAYKLKSVRLVSSKNNSKAFDYGYLSAEGTNQVRRLGFTPSNELNTAKYGKEIEKLAKEHKLKLKFISNTELKKMGAGAFTAVDQGDPNSKGGIYELSYLPTKAKNKAPIALVGKGLCYDTGGYDIKTGGYMTGMKGDMQGSAVALATILTIQKMKLPLRVKAYLVVTENHISPKAYKADDVVTALNGLSIEVVNTDAEGRMALADTLTLASRAKPDVIMDFATLTGGAVYSIGTRYGAAFTNQEAWHSKIVKAGKDSGERVWTFPLDADYAKALESPIADTLQCSRARGCDHIIAASFLKRFLENEVPWVHLDLSAAENKGGLGHVDSEYTGFGVRFGLQFLKDRYKV